MARSVDDFLKNPVLFAQQELERAPAFLMDREAPCGQMRGIEYYPAEVLPKVYAQALRNFLGFHQCLPQMDQSMRSQDHVFYSKFYRYFPTSPNPAAKHISIHYLSEPLRERILLPKRHVLRKPRDLLSLEPSVGASLFIRPTLGNDDALKLSCEDFLRNRLQVYSRLSRSVRRRYGLSWGEWIYGVGPQRVVVEEDLSEVMTGFEYQFNCRCGRVKMIRKGANLHTKDPKRVQQAAFYPDGRHCRGSLLREIQEGKGQNLPASLDLMIQVSENIASNFDAIRVDFIETRKGIVLGELSCFPGNARYHPTTPELEDLFSDAMSMAD